MRRRLHRLIAALAALAGLLFLQAALAFAQCEVTTGTSTIVAVPAVAMPDCDAAHAPADLCLAHCQSDDPTLGKTQPNVPDAAPALVAALPPQPLQRARRPAQAAVPIAGPPRRILYQSFLL